MSFGWASQRAVSAKSLPRRSRGAAKAGIKNCMRASLSALQKLQLEVTVPTDCTGIQRGLHIARCPRMTHNKRFVYVLRSIPHRDRYYCGVSSDVARRLETHNSGGSPYTASLRPWELVVSVEFARESSAVAFERYLKSGSGRAFAKRHFT